MAPCYGWRSPHTRGARGQALRRLGPRRIIPAYAGSTGPPPAETQRRLHHPRIRGEHDVFADQVAQTKGSSPHTRGALVMVTHTFYYIRIIPAYAGSTGPPPAETQRRLHHPRIRGEHDFARSKTSRRDQSSPHTRGARLRPLKDFAPRPIIPAYAGSTPRQPAPRPQGRGSSPHTRGAPQPVASVTPRRGIIPAYAGSTEEETKDAGTKTDHPRIRGEHKYGPYKGTYSTGSSPHTRGARGRAPLGRHPGGIIPAYAGSTPARGQRHTTPRDHPRIRGEHGRRDERRRDENGSSPHTRGARSLSPRASQHRGIIPAYAGSTVGCHVPAGCVWDHPRIRGEHTQPSDSGPTLVGSSPHTRGAPRG